MNTSKYITVVIGNDDVSVAETITRVDYGLKLRIKGVALPATYEVDFSLSEKGGESVTVIGDAQGAEIPVDHIKTGKNIFAYLYWTGENYGRRIKKIMIPNDAGPDRTDIAPEPAEQSVIDQTIAKLNEAVSHAPRIGTDGCWELWDPEQGEYVSTGENSKGDNGNSGVYIGDDEPTDEDINVWIDTDGDADEGDADEGDTDEGDTPSGALKYVKDDPSDNGGVVVGHVTANVASGLNACAGGCGTIAARKSQYVIGEYNVADTEGEDGTNRGEYVLIVGNGDSNNRSNAFAIKWDGTFVMADGTEVPVADISELATRLNVHFTNGAKDKTYTQIVAAINAGKTVTGYCDGTPSASVQIVHNDYRNTDEVKFVFIEGVYETQYMRLTGLKARAITVGPNYVETSSYNTISFDA